MPPIHNADTSIDHLDFQITCCATRTDGTGVRCPHKAVAYLVYHRVGCCHRGADQFGNMSGSVCQYHLDLLTGIARDLLASDNGVFLYRRGRKPQKVCGSCGNHLNELSDIVIQEEAL